MSQFSSALTQEDQCAVMCILSHGGDGFLCGSDGNKVDVNELLQPLNNINCKKMATKPKILIIQTCQGGEYNECIVSSVGSSIVSVW